MGGYLVGGKAGYLIFKVIAFVLASYVFSVIFWGTKQWMEKKSKKK